MTQPTTPFQGLRTTGLVGGLLGAASMAVMLLGILVGADASARDWGILGAVHEIAWALISAGALLFGAMICVGLGWVGVSRSGRVKGSLPAVTAGVWFSQPALIIIGGIFGALGVDTLLAIAGGLDGLTFIVALILSAVAVGAPALKGTAGRLGRGALLVGLIVAPFTMVSGDPGIATGLSALVIASLGLGLGATGFAQRGLR